MSLLKKIIIIIVRKKKKTDNRDNGWHLVFSGEQPIWLFSTQIPEIFMHYISCQVFYNC